MGMLMMVELSFGYLKLEEPGKLLLVAKKLLNVRYLKVLISQSILVVVCYSSSYFGHSEEIRRSLLPISCHICSVTNGIKGWRSLMESVSTFSSVGWASSRLSLVFSI